MQALLNVISQITLSDDVRRVFHGRGGLYPDCEQWSLDWFAPVWVLTSFKPVNDAELAELQIALEDRWQVLAPGEPLNWVFQCRAQGEAQTRLMAGSVPEPHVVTEQGARYIVHLMRGQNHGLFLDMAVGREWLKNHALHENILNLFAYTCAFSVVALQGGAAQVVNLDMSQAALAVGQQNHRLNDLPAKARFLGHDIFKTWGKISKMGPYGVIVIDPPSYQKGSFIATKDYIKLIRRLPDLLEPQGHVLLCLNAPELDSQFLHSQVAEAAPSLKFVERLANPAAFADIDPEKSLKVLHYQNT
ncbi:class I SAM-dependent methyltransferase [Limnohabitans sp.]|jgi:23S rRNA (cytosine1962-C5)-methyltransferase|uniref:class I SAM-dependent methyltransferase n=1 Tax=Limnohabitans sp. TaxID=1907725 RepID=UPI0037C0F785